MMLIYRSNGLQFSTLSSLDWKNKKSDKIFWGDLIEIVKKNIYSMIKKPLIKYLHLFETILNTKNLEKKF